MHPHSTPKPTADQFSQSDSLLWNILSTTPNNKLQAQTLQDKKEFISNLVGSVHGQRLASISTIQLPSLAANCPVPSDAVVEITYKFNDNMYYPWVVEHFRVLEQEEIQAYSPAFSYEYYEGCTDWSPMAIPATTEHQYFHNGNSVNYINETFV